jgi:hypothetical protein
VGEYLALFPLICGETTVFRKLFKFVSKNSVILGYDAA